MCCFSMPMRFVSDTKIFIRDAGRGRQFLVYSMDYQSDAEGAMILPLPVVARTREDDVRFITLEKYPDFFGALRSGFPERVFTAPEMTGAGRSAAAEMPEPQLRVHAVGRFEASFVPTIDDFGRLDPRFRLPDNAWADVPEYNDYGFAVFKLRPGPRPLTLHPMALEFPRRNADQLFIPAVHIHDGKYHPVARFDHDIYCQTENESRMAAAATSRGAAASFIDVARTDGIVDGDAPCFKKTIRDTYRNADLVVLASGHMRWIELTGDVEKIAYPGGVGELLSIIFSDIVLRNAIEIDACRQRHPRIMERYFDDQQSHVDAAVLDLGSRLEAPVARARALYRRHVPKGLLNPDLYFEHQVPSVLRSALRPVDDWLAE